MHAWWEHMVKYHGQKKPTAQTTQTTMGFDERFEKITTCSWRKAFLKPLLLGVLELGSWNIIGSQGWGLPNTIWRDGSWWKTHPILVRTAHHSLRHYDTTINMNTSWQAQPKIHRQSAARNLYQSLIYLATLSTTLFVDLVVDELLNIPWQTSTLQWSRASNDSFGSWHLLQWHRSTRYQRCSNARRTTISSPGWKLQVHSPGGKTSLDFYSGGRIMVI